MKTRTESAWQFLEPRAPLDLKKLQEGVRTDARDLGPWLVQMNANSRIRDCVWAGQSPDGRKRRDYLGSDPTPYEGAADGSFPAVDETINECKLVMTAAQRACRLEVKGHNSDQDSAAAIILPVVNYVLNTQMRADVQSQSKLWADTMLEHGHGFLHVGWLTARDLEERSITVEDLLGMALQMAGAGDPAQPEAEMQAAQMEVELWELLLDPARRDELVDLLAAYDPQMTKGEAGRVATQLRKGAAATYFAPYVRESRPTWEALVLGADITLSPAALMDIQKAPRITRWHWVTEAQLYDMATLEEWDMVAVDKVATMPGPMWDDFQMGSMPPWVGGTLGVGAVWTAESAKAARLYHFAETWERRPTKAGPSALYRTIHHGGVPDRALYHGVVKDKHGKIPIIPLQREVKSKMILGSRGIPQTGQGWQNSLKLHGDALDDNTDLRMRPPMNVPQRRFKLTSGGAAEPLPISPWKQIPFGSGEKDGISFMAGLPDPSPSVEIQESLRAQMRRYYGCADPTVPPPVTQMHQQELVAVFLHGLGQAIDLTFQLCQQYMDPIVGARVAGMVAPLNATREQIQGEWQMDPSYDVKELDMEFLIKKFDLIAKMLQFDSGGAVPRGELMSYVFAAADPVLSQRLKIDTHGGSNAAKQDESSVIAEQVAGQRVLGRLESPKSRLEAHWEWVRNPEVMQMLSQRPSLLQVELMRAKALEMNLMQETQNPTTGRTGEEAEAPWEEGGKYSDWLQQTFGMKGAGGMPQNVTAMGMAA